MAWTPELIEAITAYWKKGFSATEIAFRIGNGFSRNAVIGKLNRLRHIADGSHTPRQANRTETRRRKQTTAKPKNAAPSAPTRGRARGARRSSISVSPPTCPEPKYLADTLSEALMSLQDGECHWPVPGGYKPSNGFCGAPVGSLMGQPYCPFHRRLSRNKRPCRSS